ncbi:MAG: hypothetical protein CME71_07140 [Halobacteriovorax sp.]|nr:hypothetical protein [Halobacteriovorax sp.]
MSNTSKVNTYLVVAIYALTFALTHLLDIPSPNAAAIFLSTTILWFTELLPLAITALIVPILAVFTGVLDPKASFALFGDPILFLFIGSFLLAGAMEKHGWDKRIAYLVLSRAWASKSIDRLCTILALICWTLSMWISNTATCAIMTPMVLGIGQTLKDQLNSEKDSKALTQRLLLITAFASSIGGMATPVGSPPNLIALSLLKEQDISISFLQWMGFGVPISLLMLIALLLLLRLRMPVQAKSISSVSLLFKSQLHQLGRLKRSELIIAFVFLIAVVGWISPDLFSSLYPEAAFTKSISARLNMGVVGLFSAMMLFILRDEQKAPILNWNDTHFINWSVILLFGGGLCLGKILDVSMLATHISNIVFFGIFSSDIGLIIITILFAILLSEFSSNTASASILVPIVLAQVIGSPTDFIIAVSVAVALGASCGFMLPVSTPPNAIIYGTGKIELRAMIKNGISFDVIGFMVISLMLIIRTI